jgi:hypothetical protein
MQRSGGGIPRLTSVTLPQRGSVERQRGAHSRIRIDVTFALLRCVLLGGMRPRPNVEDITMTTQKDFKRLVRGRMQKTGESYTAARATLLAQSAKLTATNGHGPLPPTPEETTAPSAVPADFAKLAGMSDESIKTNTGCTWEKWVWALDQVNAHNWPHGEIARYVKEKYKVRDWWTQAVTVGYERIRGLRATGQRRSGSWEASKSKTINVAAGTVFKAFKQPKLRSRWLPGHKAVVRSAVPNKTIRLTWEDGTSVEVYVVSKGRSKTQVAIQHTKLTSRQAVDQMKAFWGDHLDALASTFGAKANAS